MTRFPVLAAAALFVIAPAAAQTSASYYVATPATAPAKASLVTRSTLWNCTGSVCIAAKATARDNIMCELVAREVGQLTAFRANGADFDTDTLAKCNAKAR